MYHDLITNKQQIGLKIKYINMFLNAIVMCKSLHRLCAKDFTDNIINYSVRTLEVQDILFNSLYYLCVYYVLGQNMGVAL